MSRIKYPGEQEMKRQIQVIWMSPACLKMTKKVRVIQSVCR